jgi:hypothetical protein
MRALWRVCGAREVGLGAGPKELRTRKCCNFKFYYYIFTLDSYYVFFIDNKLLLLLCFHSR